MTVRALVVDDERLARQRLRRLLSELSVDVIAEGENGVDAIELVSAHAIDILFIDINMPKKNGLDAAAYINSHIESPPSIVFTTAYDEFALEAFKANASAYLLKPISSQELSKVIEQAGRLNQLHLSSLKQTIVPLAQSVTTTLSIGLGGSIENLDIAEILYFRSSDKHVFAVIKGRGDVLVDYTLKKLEEKLEKNFVRIHRNALVNKASISKLSRDDEGRAYLHIGDIAEPLQVSRRHFSVVKKCFV